MEQIDLETILELESELERNESGFEIKSDQSADWAMRKIKKAESEKKRLTDLAKTQIENIKENLKKATAECDRTSSFMKSKLEQYFRSIPEENLKSTKTQKSYKLLSGSLVMKNQKIKMEKDDAKLVEFFEKENLDKFIKVTKEPDWKEFKKQIKIHEEFVEDEKTGEIKKILKIATYNDKTLDMIDVLDEPETLVLKY